MKDFFISYNRADKRWAEWIAWQLESGGYSVLIQAWDFRQGGNYVLDMQRALEDSRRTLLVLSPDFLRSQFTAPEWAATFAKDPSGSQGLLLPVRVRECQPSGLLAQLVYVDLVGLKNQAQARELLLQGAAQGRVKPAIEPGMPALERGSNLRSEPPWPPGISLFARLAGTVFWRLLRDLALMLLLALGVLFLLRAALPAMAEEQAGKLYAIAMVCGLVLVLALEGALHALGAWRLRRGVRA
ncbi:hypothetical protein DBR47_00290 [Paucibacter sp. KBW04]|uniref:toll/interleukin-1 receptor domain-containing protein n=1 Tax=Paucibacter sp. KBW04 TaxID=2153361 RepID=UPI000F57DDE3|nr:toll/interleukin-1 receptor domain-containing protein [Paucibacter sp. KBW04]RQO63051.1 hypothetical protein DBR47_00290 [Paucibacter sp. KBW04]